MNIYKPLNKMTNILILPFIVSSLLISFSQLLNFISYKTSDEVMSFSALADALLLFVPLVFSFFMTYYSVDGRKDFKALWVMFCTFAFYSVFTQSKSYFFAVCISLLSYYCYKNLNTITASLLILLSSLVFAVLFTYVYDYYINVVMALCTFVAYKGNLSSALFGLINSLLSPFDVSSFKNMFYFKSFGSVVYDGSSIISGAANIFKNGIKSSAITKYLSGHSYLLFLIVGSFFSIVKKLKGKEKFALLVIFLSAVFCGNINLFMLFIFLQSPYLFLSLCVISALCYFTASILNVSSGFYFGGGIFEILINTDKYVYLFAVGIVFVAIGYFVSEYFYEKYGISALLNIYIPKRLSDFVDSLGGVQNILNLNGAFVEVRNPKLVNQLSLNCLVKENKIELDKSRVSDLKEYIT